MKIIADENIPFIKEAFGSFTDLATMPGRTINAGVVKDAQALLVRSVTKVDKNLLEDSSVEFVGTATIGVDHIDTEYLKSRKIGFASAEGSNANSVAEYIIACLLALNSREKISLKSLTLGIVGLGNVGKKCGSESPEPWH